MEELEAEQKRLANAEGHLLNAQQALHLCQNDDEQNDAYQAIQYALQKLDPLLDSTPALASTHELLNQAYVIIDEACNELGHYINGFEINPQRLQQVEERLNAIYDLARKNKVKPEAFSGLGQSLSSARKKAATKLANELIKHLKQLALDKAQVKFEVDSLPIHKANQYGLDDIQFLVSLNPGQPLQPLHKVASGGELSRISLALQILIQQGSDTLIFDEIDVGVGRLLKQLGKNKQVISVTHQPQVAALAHQHLLVNKLSANKQTRTQIRNLNSEQRQQELARMLGGLEINELTLAHAKDMLGAAQA